VSFALRCLLLASLVGCSSPSGDVASEVQEWTGSPLEAALNPTLRLVRRMEHGKTVAQWTTVEFAPLEGVTIDGVTVTGPGQTFQIRGAEIVIPLVPNTVLAVRPEEPEEITLHGRFPWRGVRRTESLTLVVEASIDGVVQRFARPVILGNSVGRPTLVEPAVGASDVAVRPRVSWSMEGRADSIEIEIGPRAEGEDIAEGDDFIEMLLPGAATSFELPEGLVLRPSTAYEVRLWAMLGSSVVEVSADFTTVPAPVRP
jgi:hypothetical protein